MGHGDPLNGKLRLELLLRGTHRNKSGGKVQRLPISPLILDKIFQILNHNPGKYENKLMWAACCLGFFASFARENSQFRAMNLTTHRGICQCRMWQWTPWITHWGCKWGLRVRKWINGAAVYASWLEELRRRFVP